MTTQNKNIPTLRFPEYVEQWNEICLDKFLIPTLREIDKPNESYLAIGIRSHCKGTFQKPDSEPEKIAMDKLFVVKENDLIVNITFAWEGAIAIVKKKDEGGLVSHRFPTYTFNENISSHNFFQYIFTQKKFRTTLELISPGGAGRNRVLSKKDFLKIKVNLPALPEQQKITKFLTAVNEKIQQITKKKHLLEQYKKGVMRKIFNQEFRFKDENGNEFADWEEKEFGEVVTNKSEKYNPEKDKANYKCIELEHLASETSSLLGYVNSNNSGSIKNKFHKGDVLFGKLRPYLKKYLLAPFDGVCSSEIWVLKGKDILNNFLFRLIQTDEFISLANQSTGLKMPRADWKVVSASLFAIPSKPEQEKIADFLSAIDDKINLVNQQLEKTKEYKKGLLQQMFI